MLKKIKHTVNSKPKEWQIGDLVDYIRNPDVKNKGEKIEHAGGMNFLTDTHAAQKLEMICLARESVRSKMPVSHYVFSCLLHFFSGRWVWKDTRQFTDCTTTPEIIMCI